MFRHACSMEMVDDPLEGRPSSFGDPMDGVG